MREKIHTALLLALLALLTIAVQGYHYGTDDAAIYMPAIARFVHPHLFPFGQDFFLSHGRLSIFPALAGGLARLVHISVAASVMVCYVCGTWLLLVAAWQLAAFFFASARARWTAVSLLAAMLPVQVAGTAIPIMDAYFTARTISTPLTLFALVAALHRRWVLAALCIAATILVHPQMAVYAAMLVVGIAISTAWPRQPVLPAGSRAYSLALLSFGSLGALFPRGPATGAFREALYARAYLFAQNWTVAEWLGMLCPMLILLWLSRRAPKPIEPHTRRFCGLLVILGALATLLFLALSAVPQLDALVRLQPMRILQLVYVVMFLLLGGLAGEYLIGARTWRAAVLFMPIAVGMYALDRWIYPASPHLEWPGQATVNPWLQAFAWIKSNTPDDAVFAIDPEYLRMDGEDSHGFRAMTERSVLADAYKDGGVAEVFPAVAPEWGREVEVQRGWRTFKPADFQRLSTIYPVTWVAVNPAQAAGMDCPYSNAVLAVCRIPHAAVATTQD